MFQVLVLRRLLLTQLSWGYVSLYDWPHRGHYSLLLPARLHLGGQWDSDLSTWREVTDGRTTTILPRLVLYMCVVYKDSCACLCKYSSQCMFIHILLCVCARDWNHSAKVVCSQQHLLHHLTDCQQGPSSLTAGGKQHLCFNSSKLTKSEYYWPKIIILCSPATKMWLKDQCETDYRSAGIKQCLLLCSRVEGGLP